MDLSFDIKNSEGDHIMVALSYYDYETVSAFFADPRALPLVFYDVALMRKEGNGYVGYKMLFTISDIRANFMEENEDAVLCFYCDSSTDVHRNHEDMIPQEYRSKLFSRMFELYVNSHSSVNLINHRVEIEDPDNPNNKQFTHFICRKEYEGIVASMGQMLMQK